MEDSIKLIPNDAPKFKQIRRANNGCSIMIDWAKYKTMFVLGGAMSVTVLISVIISTVYLESKLVHLSDEKIEKVEKNVFQRLESVTKKTLDSEKEVRDEFSKPKILHIGPSRFDPMHCGK